MKPKNMVTAERLKKCRTEKDKTLEQIGEMIGAHKTTVMRWENGETERISLPTIQKLSEFYNVNPAWLMGADVPMRENAITSRHLVSPTVTDDVVTFPVIGEIAAGYNCIANEDWSGDTVSVPALYLKGRPTSDFFVLSVKGNSMYPLYQAGDTVLVLKQDFIENSGDIGAVIYDNECATLKKVEILKDMVRLVSINPEYQPKEIKGNDLELYHVLGVPRLLIREIN